MSGLMSCISVDGKAANTIVRVLRTVHLDAPVLVQKVFSLSCLIGRLDEDILFL